MKKKKINNDFQHENFSKSRRIQVLIFGILLTIMIIASFLWNYKNERDEAMNAAKETAKAQFYKDVIFRRWNAMHKKIYAPVTESTPRNPYLEDIEERDIVTPSGQELTLINPAYMTRQVHELAWETEKLRGHITSLNPIRPANEPDVWERKALRNFEQGEKEFISVEKIDNVEYLRFMKPLKVEESCLQCHAKQGYKKDDIRGGISVSVPMTSYYLIAEQHIINLAIGHIIFWLFGMAAIFLNKRNIKKVEDHILKLSRAVDQSHSVLMITDYSGKIEYVNPQFTVNCGYSAEEVIGFKPNILKSGLHSKDFYKDLWDKILSGNTWTGRIQNKKKNGSFYWEQVSISPLKNKEGKITNFLAVKLDITDSVKNEENLKETNIALERSTKELQDFVYIASHDLQEPLRKIMAFGDWLKVKFEDILPEKGHFYLERMHDASDRMRTLIDDLLSYSRLTSQSRPFENVNLNELLDIVLSEMEKVINEKKPEIIVENLPIVFGDKIQLKQLFQNLLSNAIKFSRPDIIPRINISECGSENGYSCIHVSDNGLGFEQEYEDKIFLPFNKLHSREEFDGTGIGLAICKKIIDHHNGRISVKSEVEKGSTFCLHLPVNVNNNDIKVNYLIM